jgi:nitrate/nitrite transport system substrate-binding protein
VRQPFIDENPQTYGALLRAVVDATAYSQEAANREEIAEAIASPQYLNQPVEVVKAAMTGHFDDGKGETVSEPERMGFDPYPWKSFAVWIQTQLVRWGYVEPEEAQGLDFRGVADEVFRTSDIREMQRELGMTTTDEEYKTETILGRDFDPDDPDPWLESNIAARA